MKDIQADIDQKIDAFLEKGRKICNVDTDLFPKPINFAIAVKLKITNGFDGYKENPDQLELDLQELNLYWNEFVFCEENGRKWDDEIDLVNRYIDPKKLIEWRPVDDALNIKGKIEAIKEYRSLTKEGLKESKEAVENRIKFLKNHGRYSGI